MNAFSSLSSHDINQLLEALKSWEKEPITEGFQRSMFSTILCGVGGSDADKDARLDKVSRETEINIKKSEIASNLRREQSILLQAKLIQLRNELTMAEVAA